MGLREAMAGVGHGDSLPDTPEEQPYKEDKLRREPAVRAVAQLVSAVPTPFTLAIDGPWGSGKTWALSMLRRQLLNWCNKLPRATAPC